MKRSWIAGSILLMIATVAVGQTANLLTERIEKAEQYERFLVGRWFDLGTAHLNFERVRSGEYHPEASSHDAPAFVYSAPVGTYWWIDFREDGSGTEHDTSESPIVWSIRVQTGPDFMAVPTPEEDIVLDHVFQLNLSHTDGTLEYGVAILNHDVIILNSLSVSSNWANVSTRLLVRDRTEQTR